MEIFQDSDIEFDILGETRNVNAVVYINGQHQKTQGYFCNRHGKISFFCQLTSNAIDIQHIAWDRTI